MGQVKDIVEYRVEDRGPILLPNGKELPDFRVVLYVNGQWENEWDGAWTFSRASELANRLYDQSKRPFRWRE